MTKIKTDCFAWNSDKCCCNALSDLMCKRGGCPFYKTVAQNELERQKYFCPEAARVFLCERSVVRIEDGRQYPSAKAAALQLGGRPQYIVDACNRKCGSSLGYHWQWADR